MGGRGSASLSSSGEYSVKMPELSGSPKQIEWANDIRHSVQHNVNELVKQASSEYGIESGVSKVTVEAAKVVRAELLDQLSAVTDAKRIIDRRNRLSWNSILGIAGDETRQGLIAQKRRKENKKW